MKGARRKGARLTIRPGANAPEGSKLRKELRYLRGGEDSKFPKGELCLREVETSVEGGRRRSGARGGRGFMDLCGARTSRRRQLALTNARCPMTELCRDCER